MTGAILVSLVAWLLVQIVWTIVQMHLIATLRDFYPDVHHKASAPSVASLTQVQKLSPHWHWFVLSGQFKHSCPAALAGSFRFARFCGWLAIGLLAIFLCLVGTEAIRAL